MTNSSCLAGRSCAAAALVGVLVSVSPAAAGESDIHFNRDIRSIFSNNCYTCHGPDSAQRQTSFRLDTQQGALAELDDGSFAIKPGDAAQSVLLQRITADDPDMRMPPADSGKQLKPEQIELIREWIDQGAQWQGHWSFIEPERPPLPDVEDGTFTRNAVDRFILARLEREGMSPSPPADKETLLRRVTFDLTGLPPAIAEMDAFLADESPDAYEKVVDRLLASSRYGEQMGRYWLDVARYGDTHGLHLDNERSIWPYREWVLRAFNANMPFDQFTVEQLAGDLLPNPTVDQLVATGFNRCNVTTSEGGSIPEEYRVRYAVDRVETTSTVWMGMTMGCAVCHEHKFDPFSQKEFYQLFAYFNNLDENPMDGNALLPPPTIKVPSRDQAVMSARLDKRISQLDDRLKGPLPDVDAAQADWEQDWAARLKSQWQPLDVEQVTLAEGVSFEQLDDGSVLVSGDNPDQGIYEVVTRTDSTRITAVRLEALQHGSLPANGPGRADSGNFVLSELEVEAVSVADPQQKQTVTFKFAHTDLEQQSESGAVEQAIDGASGGKNGWSAQADTNQQDRAAVFVPSEPFGFEGGSLLRFRMRHESEFPRHAIGRFRLAFSTDPALAPAELGVWHVAGPFDATSGFVAFDTSFGPEQNPDLAATYQNGTVSWTPQPDFADAHVHELGEAVSAVYLLRTIHAPTPRNVTFGIGTNDGVKVWLNGRVVLNRNVQRGVKPDDDQIRVRLEAGENRLLMKVVNYAGAHSFVFRRIKEHTGDELLQVGPLLAKPAGERSPSENEKVREYFRRNHSPVCQQMYSELARTQAERKELDQLIPASLVMRDRAEPRETFLLVRGAYDNPGEKVDAGVPAILPSLPDDAPPNRLALARWLVSGRHPLTARVTVNRFWQRIFGRGIVRTAEDFGSQGEWPSHPDLLDWLAVEFVDSGWDIKHVQRLIVTSATYRQSSRVRPEHLRRDPQNVLLARGPRFRLDAEAIRDQALAQSGLLVEHVGGKSVRPYQPPGLWEAVAYTNSNTAHFKRDRGAALYRRSVYTFWKRTSPPPSMSTFDAPSREACTVDRARTNTPLQALLLMNDDQFVEAARHLARRIMTDGGSTVEDRIAYGFRLTTCRQPQHDEVAVLRQVLDGHLAEFRQNPEAAGSLLDVGDSARDESLDPSEHAAWTMIANLLLNLDETVTKG